MKIIIVLITLITQGLTAQTIQGTFPQAKNTEVVVKSFIGFNEKDLAKTTTDSLGNYSLAYPKNYKGAALLQIKNSKSLIVLLNNENFNIQLENLQDSKTLKFTNSIENDFFANGIIVNQEAEYKLAGLRYLLPLYQESKANENWLQTEIYNQEQTFVKFIEGLPKDSYAKHYLNYRKFLGEVQLNNERYKEVNSVKQHEMAFTKIDFASDALWHSGLLIEILNSYYQVLELYQDKDSIDSKSKEANTIWLKTLKNQPIKQQEVAEYCFTLLEKKGFTKASEHIALSMLNNDNCQLTDKQTDLFEQYRKLAIGSTAPNILFNLNNLKDIKSEYKLVVFGASWCPNCQTDYPSLIGKYKKLKENHDLEIVYVSIDTDKNAFKEYYQQAPFITFCDYKGWETKAAKEYHIFATPTYILLDKNLKIVAKIQSPEHIEEVMLNVNK
jgi:thiol-disulfide isomerase/thioredoxin